MELSGHSPFIVFEDSDIDKVADMAVTAKFRNNGETRIPCGTYNLKFRNEGGFNERYSKRFPNIHKGMLEVCNVKNFKYVLIHCGNDDSHTAGCLLVGDSQENNVIIKDGFIGKSTNAYKRLYPDIARQLELGNEVTIEYIDMDRRI